MNYDEPRKRVDPLMNTRTPDDTLGPGRPVLPHRSGGGAPRTWILCCQCDAYLYEMTGIVGRDVRSSRPCGRCDDPRYDFTRVPPREADGAPAPCEHENFTATVDVGRITEVEDGPVEGFMADIRIACADCLESFRFVGVSEGLSWREPRVEIGGVELRAPIQPESADPGRVTRLPGFDVRLHGAH